MSVSGNLWFIYAMEYYSSIKRSEALIYYNMDESWKLCEWNKPDTEGYIMFDSILRNVENRQTYKDKK